MTTVTTEPNGVLRAPDGTPLAYWRTDDGPAGRPLLLVHGTTSDHTTWNELLGHAAAARPTYVYDRRGRGRSGDESPGAYGLQLEATDLTTVLAAIAEREGSSVDVLAHSFGAFVALAGLTVDERHVHALAAYSPGFGASYPPGTLEEIDRLIAAGDMDEALWAILRDVIGMTHDDIDFMSRSPVWQTRKEVAVTVPRECRADAAFLDERSDALARLGTPVIIISGATNTPDKKAIATRLDELLPSSTFVELAGEGHAAHHTAPAELLRTALDFFEATT